MELNVNVNVRIENLDQILAALSTLVTVAPALPAVPTEDKPVRRGRPRKAVEKTEEPKAEEPKAEPAVEEPKVEEPKAEEPKDLLPALRAQCMALSRVAGADRVLQVIKSFGFKGLTAVPVEKHAELLQILVDEIKAAEDK
jgi:septal ring-binding cell division protein DamX